MLLITARVWFGPGRYWPADMEFHGRQDHLEGLVTRMSLPEAIKKIKSYSQAFGGPTRLSAIEYHIISVAEIEPLTDDQIHDAGMLLVDKMEWTDD